MRLLSVIVDGFRAFGDQQVVEMPQGAGLYLMRGKNHVDKALEGNDVGKSTFWDAVYWGLYGETTRGLRAGNVVSWGAETADVEQTWLMGGRKVKIRRRQSPNGMWVDGARLDGAAGIAAVQEKIGLSGDEFLHSVMAGQFTSYFLDLGPAEKLAIFSDVLKLAYWEDLSTAAKRDADRFAAKVASLDGQRQTEKGRRGAIKERCRVLALDMEKWDREHGAKRLKLEKRVKRLQRDVDVATRALDDADKILGVAVVTQKKQSRLVQQLRQEFFSINDKLMHMRSDVQFDRCPFCKRPMVDSWRDKIKGEIARSQKDSIRLGKQLDVEKGNLDVADRNVAKLQRRREECLVKFTELQCTLDDIRRTLDEEPAENPHEASLEATRGDLAASREKLGVLTAERDLAATSQARYAYWVKGFRDLRLWILDSTLAELEMRVNNSMVQLGLERWSIHLAVERETKAGGVSRGFVVDVRSPESSEAAPWKGWGGGVSQRLRIAAEIGLSKLIADRKGIQMGIEIWDEPTQHLSPRGVDDLLRHLQARSREEDKQIWVVDHRSLDFAFDGGLLVTKTLGGSTVTSL